MGKPKDDAPQDAESSVTDVFNSVANWGMEALGSSGDERARRRGAADNPFAREAGNLLPAWSLPLPGDDFAPSPGARRAEPQNTSEPLPAGLLDMYLAHEKSYDAASRSNAFIDPSSFALAVRGAPPLEPLRHNTGSISSSPTQKPAQSSAPAAAPLSAANASLGSPPTPVSTSFSGSDAISGGAASLHSSGGAGRATAAIWRKLWRY